MLLFQLIVFFTSLKQDERNYLSMQPLNKESQNLAVQKINQIL